MVSVRGPYKMRVDDIHDGDTLVFDIDLGFGVGIFGKSPIDKQTQLECRVYGIDAPELKTAEGKASLAFAKTLLKPGDICTVLSHFWDKFGGRFDGEIQMPDGRDFATVMVDNGQAVRKAY